MPVEQLGRLMLHVHVHPDACVFDHVKLDWRPRVTPPLSYLSVAVCRAFDLSPAKLGVCSRLDWARWRRVERQMRLRARRARRRAS